MSMEIAQLCKSTYNNQLQQSMYICHKTSMSQVWQVNTAKHILDVEESYMFIVKEIFIA